MPFGNDSTMQRAAGLGARVQGERYWTVVAESLRRYVAGKPLANVVDILRGSSSA